MMRINLLRTILAHSDEDRIVTNTEFVNRIQKLTGSTIHLRQHISPASVTSCTFKFGIRYRRQMDLHMGNICEERFIVFRAAFHELNCAISEFGIDLGSGLSIVDSDFPRRLTLP